MLNANCNIVSKASAWGFETLEFSLPHFSRQLWVSESARERWNQRIVRFARSSADTAWHSVVSGIRPCSLCWLSVEELLEWYARSIKSGLRILPLAMRRTMLPGYADKPYLRVHRLFRIVVGKKSDVLGFGDAWHRGAHTEIGELLGYPECCRQFFEQVVLGRQFADNTWPTAWNTVNPSEGTRIIEVEGNAVLNTIWRASGLVIIPHLPCSFRCARSLRLGEALVTVAHEIGYGAEMDSAIDMLHWPAEWTAFHGIAEVKTPILKMSSNTVATPHKYTVKWLGSGYPQEGASGMSFPFQTVCRSGVQSTVS